MFSETAFILELAAFLVISVEPCVATNVKGLSDFPL